MDPDASDRWSRTRALFEDALALAPDARAPFLDAACGDDADLRATVERLLAADAAAADATDFLDEDAEADFVPLISQTAFDRLDAAPSASGHSIGPYRLLDLVGEGGMGEVYRATRADGAFEQTVALKLVKRGMDTRAVLRRFAAERSILARLDHPGIARLLGGGATDEGRPWFAMEYVDGEPITEAAPDLDLDARLQLFDAVCAAVQHAHARLVVHRDLKPSNILVVEAGPDTGSDAAPGVKLLDFGIAKLLDDTAADASVLTATGVRPMTRAYAAPEQIRGEAVTTATDVYALGVILYEILTGHRPFEAVATADLERDVLDTDPVRPSTALRKAAKTTALSSTVSASRLQSGLDSICLKALRKEPEARYASVEALREDLRRFREDLPILARAPTVGYRVGRFVRRHRVGVVATAAVLLLLASGVTFYTVRLAEARDRAELAATRAEQTATFLEQLFERSNPTGEDRGAVTAREILDVGAEQARETLADEPVVRAQMLATIGRVYRALGLYDESAPLLDEAEALFDSTGLDPLGHRDALLELANLRYRTEDYAAAEPLARRALALDSLHASAGDSKRLPILNTIGLILSDVGTRDGDPAQLQSAADLLQEVIEARRPLDDATSQTDLSVNLSNLGLILIDLGRHDEAEPILDEALALIRTHRGADHPYLAFALNSRVAIYEHRREFGQAIADQQQSVEIGEAALGPDHPFVDYARGNLRDLVAKRDSLQP